MKRLQSSFLFPVAFAFQQRNFEKPHSGPADQGQDWRLEKTLRSSRTRLVPTHKARFRTVPASLVSSWDLFPYLMNASAISPSWILIDRCGKHFGTILNYLRDGAVPLPESRREIEELLAEAKYYLVQGLVEECQAALQQNKDTYEPFCKVPVITSSKEEQKLIATSNKPAVKLLYNRSNNKYSYTRLIQTGPYTRVYPTACIFSSVINDLTPPCHLPLDAVSHHTGPIHLTHQEQCCLQGLDLGLLVVSYYFLVICPPLTHRLGQPSTLTGPSQHSS
ncbi:BTB/POZ domain-containing adapter for CUL3-mediated RhoA degradation protein 3 [Pontoporia blainvillei]|uniref:BTB/POZ domain-containing adapter for CUL3-mediated RhoA degradation protein 3 n=1 Tax=Pontoporia blainvillei TaxID=48723 RepID=A0ABX0S3G6_PONBL|nr:BTB/POZ domain-containing adapter for CUL3-mediated RhoA degradation protein 3 [Pontoporia blainvillei]